MGNSFLKLYPCDALGKVRGNDESHTYTADIGFSGVMAIRKFDELAIKVGETEGLGFKGTLQFKESKTITSEVVAQQNERIILDNISVTGRGKKVGVRNNGMHQAVFGVEQGGSLFVRDGKVDITDVYGLVGESAQAVFSHDGSLQNMSNVVFESSDITIKGRESFGLHFQGNSSEESRMEGELLVGLGEIQFKNTTFKVPDGTAVYIDDAGRFPYITVSEGSRIFANRLLAVKNNSYVAIEADASFLAGRAHVDKSSYAEIELSNKSQWTLSPGKNNKWPVSSVSFMRIIDSSIFFRKPVGGQYQTLHVGKLDDDNGLDYAYVASGARLLVNASLATDGQNKGIKADKLLIYGNVYGKTKVHVMEVSANSGKRESLNINEQRDAHSVSIVQVYGEAEEDSFKLATNYVALRGEPYRYSLRAYGQSSSLGKAKDENRLVKPNSGESNGDFWDFRLEAEYIPNSFRYYQSKTSLLKKAVSRSRVSRSIGSRAVRDYVVADSTDSVFYPEWEIQAVVPQVPTYLLLPNALFRAGLMDISNQNKQLEALRVASGDFLESGRNSAFFMRWYGGSHHYGADLSTLKYGYRGNLDYNAVEAGVLLKAVESAHRTTAFGIIGTYGKIALQPQDVVESKKSSFDKWSVAAYASMQHDAGSYLDSLLSYGLFKGDVLALARGKTATLKGNPLSASLIFGKAFMAGYKGLVFESQIQVIYQNLQFDKTSDIDGFDIKMGRLDQWVMRVGGRMTKTLTASQMGHVVSFNGKLHFAHNFGRKQFVYFGDKFQLGAFGSSLEIGGDLMLNYLQNLPCMET